MKPCPEKICQVFRGQVLGLFDQGPFPVHLSFLISILPYSMFYHILYSVNFLRDFCSIGDHLTLIPLMWSSRHSIRQFCTCSPLHTCESWEIPLILHVFVLSISLLVRRYCNYCNYVLFGVAPACSNQAELLVFVIVFIRRSNFDLQRLLISGSIFQDR